MAIMFRHQSCRYRHLCRDGIMPGAVGLGLAIALNAAFFAATPSDSTAAAPPAIASATPLTAPVVTDPASEVSWPIPTAAWGSGFSSSIGIPRPASPDSARSNRRARTPSRASRDRRGIVTEPMEPIVQHAWTMPALTFAPHPRRAGWRRDRAGARSPRPARATLRWRPAFARCKCSTIARRPDIGISRGEIAFAAAIGRHGIVNRPVPQGTARAPAAPHAPPLTGAQSLSSQTSPKR
jgi:hypothetical protein